MIYMFKCIFIKFFLTTLCWITEMKSWQELERADKHNDIVGLYICPWCALSLTCMSLFIYFRNPMRK